MNPGRPALRSNIVEHLDADPDTKERLKILLQTIAGELSVSDACKKLNICQARFFELRTTMLKAALSSLEPKPAGRPRQKIDSESQRIQQLEQHNLDLRVHLAAAQLREEIALAMPHLSQRHPSKRKKKTRSSKPPTPASSYQIASPNNLNSESSTPGSCDT